MILLFESVLFYFQLFDEVLDILDPEMNQEDSEMDEDSYMGEEEGYPMQEEEEEKIEKPRPTSVESSKGRFVTSQFLEIMNHSLQEFQINSSELLIYCSICVRFLSQEIRSPSLIYFTFI